MKKLNFLIILLSILALHACTDKIVDTVTYKVNEPVLMNKVQFRAPVKVTSEAKSISKEGKICFYEGFLYISESEVGIHIIDDRDPYNPQNVGFIELLGNTDVVIRNGILYADSYIDMVWFNISNPASPTELGRAEDIFPNALPVTGNGYGYDWEKMNANTETSIVVGWTVEEKTVPVNEANYGWWNWGSPVFFDGVYTSNAAESSTSGSTSVNGSMTRFVFYDEYLYSVFNNQLSIFKFNEEGTPDKLNDVYVGGNVETIFSYKNNLFMGTPTGMLIYSVADPTLPEYQSSVWHAYGCDPVVVENDVAYITIHSGNTCGQTENLLIAEDVSDVKNPKEIASYAMKNPKGLGIDDGILFLCDDGLKVFDAKDPQTLVANAIHHFTNIDGYDVIPLNKMLMMIASDGIYQYDYYDLNNIKLMSKLSFTAGN